MGGGPPGTAYREPGLHLVHAHVQDLKSWIMIEQRQSIVIGVHYGMEHTHAKLRCDDRVDVPDRSLQHWKGL